MPKWNIQKLSEPQTIDDAATELLALFSSGLTKSAERFRQASLANDLAATARICHSMRGAAAIYGFTCLAERLQSIEVLIQAGELRPISVAEDLTLVADGIARYANDRVINA